MTESFDLGDFIETLPYEGGPMSPDEYIANQLIIKRLQLRNEKIREKLLNDPKLSKRHYVGSTDKNHYITLSERDNYQHTDAVAKLELDLNALKAKIAAKKEAEIAHGKTTKLLPTKVLTVRSMTAAALEKIELEEHLGGAAEDDL